MNLGTACPADYNFGSAYDSPSSSLNSNIEDYRVTRVNKEGHGVFKDGIRIGLEGGNLSGRGLSRKGIVTRATGAKMATSFILTTDGQDVTVDSHGYETTGSLSDENCVVPVL